LPTGFGRPTEHLSVKPAAGDCGKELAQKRHGQINGRGAGVGVKARAGEAHGGPDNVKPGAGGTQTLVDPTLFADPNAASNLIRSVLEASTEYSIIGIDLEGTILLWNEGARRLYGYEPENVIGNANGGTHRKGFDRALSRTLIEAISVHAPVVLVFEDFHYADGGLIDFVDHLATRGKGTLARIGQSDGRIGTKAKIVAREKKENREIWTVEGLVHPGLKRTLFTFKERSLIEVELQYEYPDRTIEWYNQRMGEIRKYFDEKYGTGKLVSRSRDTDTDVIQTLVGYQWMVGATMLELFYFSAQKGALVYRTISVDYKAL